MPYSPCFQKVVSCILVLPRGGPLGWEIEERAHTILLIPALWDKHWGVVLTFPLERAYPAGLLEMSLCVVQFID